MVDLNIGVKNADETKVKGDVEEQTHDWAGLYMFNPGDP
jgi:hypothetical protein